jgi:peptidylprolyl isomerase
MENTNMNKIIIMLVMEFTFLFAANPVVILKTTQGKIELELYPKVAPKAVENFTKHVKDGYYNHIAFHRIIHNFMVQGGDPTETGRGGESIWHKPFNDEVKPGYAFDDAGVLAMANAGPNTNGSQFFITTARAGWLNGGYTIFGHVIGSMNALKKLNIVPTSGQDGGDRPLERQEIIKAYLKN